jgi:hypothetical protein
LEFICRIALNWQSGASHKSEAAVPTVRPVGTHARRTRTFVLAVQAAVLSIDRYKPLIELIAEIVSGVILMDHPVLGACPGNGLGIKRSEF